MKKHLYAVYAVFLWLVIGSNSLHSQVVINELGIAPACSSCNAAGGGEFIELYNRGPCTADISCNVILWTGTSGGGNPTGWTITIPAGTTLAPCAYYVIGGAGLTPGAGWTSLGVGGNPWNNPSGTVNLDISTSYATGLQGCRPGNLVDTKGQVNLLNSAGGVIASVSYNSGNNAGAFPAFSNAPAGCSALNPINAVANSANNVNDTWNSTTGMHGLALTAAGTYVSESTLTPGTANASQISCTTGGLVSNAPTSTNLSCNAVCNGTATASVTGGTPPYTYSWSPSGGTGITASSLCAGNYTCTIRDAGGCSGTQTFTITQPATLSATPTPSNSTCGNANGSISVVASGGTAAYTYSWAPSGGTGATASSLSSGTYTCTITDSKGCSKLITSTISNTAGPNVVLSTQTNEACNAGTTGSAKVTASSGTAPYTYSWSPSGGTAATASGLGAGTYTCTVTDANGCKQTQTATISQPSALSNTAPSVTNSTCGSNNGSISVTASGGTGALTYSWTPSGGTGSAASNLASGTYTLTIKDANGCSIQLTASVNNTGGPTVALSSQTNDLCNAGATGSATVTASAGTAPYTYSWAPSGGSGVTATNLSSGTYTCTVTDANGCKQTQTATITQPSAITAPAPVITNATCGASDGNISISPSGGTGALTYSWSPSGGNTTTASNLGSGTYTCTVTDANGCSKQITASVNNIGGPAVALSSQTNNICNAGTTGSATVTASAGTAPYTYSWSPSGGVGVTANNLGAGTYTCTVTDANGCKQTQTATITQPSAITAASPTVTNSTCGNSNGSISVSASGGTGALTYSWSPSGGNTSTASNLGAGSYTCTITDTKGCSAQISSSVNNTGGPAVSLTFQTNNLCNAGSLGSATVTPTGGTTPYTFSWSPSGGTSASANNLSAGTYTCTVTDANGCQQTQLVTITEPAALNASAPTVTNVNCNGACNGSAVVSATGGTGSYTYSWSPSGGNSGTASSLCAGTYTCTISDANNCQTLQTAVVTEPVVLAVSVSAITPASCNTSNGSATVTVSGGTGAYTFSWSPSGGTAATANGLAAGSYNLTVNDASGCSQILPVNINNSGGPNSTLSSSSNSSCNGSCNGSATVNASGGTGTLTYSWSPSGGIAATANALCAGSYTCTISDSNNCITTQTVTITQPALLQAPAPNINNITCNGANNGSVSIAVSGGTGPYTYSWSPSGGTSAGAVGLSPGSYTCTIIDANGCSMIDSAAITQPVILASGISGTQSTCGLNNGSAAVTATGGTGSYTYAWSPSGGTSSTASTLPAGLYTCIVSDANGCTQQDTLTIANVGNPPVAIVLASGPTTFCQGSTVTLTASGGGTYSWSNGVTADSIVVSATGTYSVTVTNACGTNSTSNAVTVNPLPVAAIAGASNVCQGDSILLSASGGTSYSWSNGSTSNPIYVSTGGTYSVTVTNGCGSATAQTNVTFNSVTSHFTADSTTGYAPFNVNFTTNGSSNATSWSWNFGDGTTGTGQTPSHTYPTAGTYTATCTATDANGCTDTYKMVITVLELPSWLNVPNVFTPNGDGKNDIFLLNYQGIVSFEMKIYDRWGVELADITNVGEGWDGRTKAGVLASAGTYYYIIHATGTDKKIYNLQGFLQLMD
ncbi:MAG TPA: gliding motility-associated C-terminal domain-containing protein [Bacteroidia bacterium]|nr:gliding motility-associated C-terminal domain-containing protein [Bacteroidia bacterium]